MLSPRGSQGSASVPRHSARQGKEDDNTVDEPEEEKEPEELRIEIRVSPVDQGHILLQDVVSIFRREGIAEQILDAITGQNRGRQVGQGMDQVFDLVRGALAGQAPQRAVQMVSSRGAPPVVRCQHNYRYVERNDVGQSVYRCTECQDALTLTGTVEGRTEEGGDEDGTRGEEEAPGPGGD